MISVKCTYQACVQDMSGQNFCRIKKLQGTLLAVQQLEGNMSELRKWLAQIEHQIGSPVVYRTCDQAEIYRQISEQQVITCKHTLLTQVLIPLIIILHQGICD